jgi:hypothetical protein
MSGESMSVPTTTDISVKRKVKDGWHVYTCDQLPGLYVAHVDDRVAYNDVPRSVESLLKLNFGMDCKVSHKVSYADFVRQCGIGGARGVSASLMRCNGVGRNAEWPKSLVFYFNAVPTDDQMRYLQEVMARAAACMPEDLR